MKPQLKPPGLITLINRGSHTIYSGMIAGVVAGKYNLDQIKIDLRDLAAQAGVSFVLAEIEGIDLSNKIISLCGRPSITYQRLSLDIGSETCIKNDQFKSEPGQHFVPIKPFNKSLEWICKNDFANEALGSEPFAIVGSGMAGVELAFALRARWPNRKLDLYSRHENLTSKVKKILNEFNILVIEKKQFISSQAALLCTGNRAPNWIFESGLPVDKDGRILTENTLQVIGYSDIFAVGDCGVIEKNPRPPSGVWAVRSSIPLAENIGRISQGINPICWYPQKKALQLLGVDFHSQKSRALCFYGEQIVGPYFGLALLKEKIDKSFVSKFKFSAKANGSYMKNDLMLDCRGCGAKLSTEPLQKALARMNISEEPEDASCIGYTNQGAALLQSVDAFPALISDPWLNARLTALHACSDIWACGGSVVSAQSLITVPKASSRLQEELLSQALNGITSALNPQGAMLIGGHTLESRNDNLEPLSIGIEIGLCVNGLVENPNNIWQKGGLQKGDQILISRQLGSGVIFAASMIGNVSSSLIDLALQEMNTSQHQIITDLNYMQDKYNHSKVVNACTDITGFGLLGHLSEMLKSSNVRRIKRKETLLKIYIEIEQIDSFAGVSDLFENGYQSTLAKYNRNYLSFLNPNHDPHVNFEILLDKIRIGSKEYHNKLELLIDPQTCGPIVIASPELFAEKLIKSGPWKKIGYVL